MEWGAFAGIFSLNCKHSWAEHEELVLLHHLDNITWQSASLENKYVLGLFLSPWASFAQKRVRIFTWFRLIRTRTAKRVLPCLLWCPILACKPHFMWRESGFFVKWKGRACRAWWADSAYYCASSASQAVIFVHCKPQNRAAFTP